jgi:hypothetical protein
MEIPQPKVTAHLELHLGMTSSTLVGVGLSLARPTSDASKEAH